jgi:hypothetical protein
MFRKLFGLAEKRQPKPNHILSMPLLRSHMDFVASDVVKKAKELFPMWPVELGEDSDKGAAMFGVPSLSAGVMVMPMPTSLPPGELDHSLPMSPFWVDAKDKPAHGSHVVMVGQGESLSAAAQAATVVGISMLNLPGGVAWYVGGGCMVHDIEVVTDLATESARDGDFPVPIWVNVIVSKNPAGGIDASTVGMDSFGHMEMEAIGSTEELSELRSRLFGAAMYVILNDVVFKHGETMGESATERIRIEVGKSKLGKDGKVVRFVMP